MRFVEQMIKTVILLSLSAPLMVAAGGDPGDMAPVTEQQVADTPYRVIDGRIDPNTIEGWKTFRGIGGCTACHGPAGEGGVGKNLMEGLTSKRLDEQQFKGVVAEGRSGTMMKAFKYNQAVMDNLDNIYAYIQARADGVLGPDNLIKYPLGKKPVE